MKSLLYIADICGGNVEGGAHKTIPLGWISRDGEGGATIKQMDFPDKWSAIVWMCRNQLGRRNVTPAQRDYLLKEEHDALVKTHGATDGFRGNQYVKVVNGQNDQLPNSSGEMFQARKVVAKEHGIKESEVRRAVEFGRGLDAAEKISPGLKEAVLSGTVKAPKSVISEIRNAPEEKKREAYKAQKMTAGGDRRSDNFSKGQNSLLKKYENTAQKIADDFGVGEQTVKRAEHFIDSLNEAEKVSPGIKAAHMAFKAESRGYSPASSFSSMQSRT